MHNFVYFTMKRRKKQDKLKNAHDDCMNAPPRTVLLVLHFLSIENYFKEHSGAQTDSKPFFLH